MTPIEVTMFNMRGPNFHSFINVNNFEKRLSTPFRGGNLFENNHLLAV